MSLKNRCPLRTLSTFKEAERRRLRFRLVMQGPCRASAVPENGRNEHDRENTRDCNRLSGGFPATFSNRRAGCLNRVHRLSPS